MKRSPIRFFALVFALSAPFWWLGRVPDLQLMPGLPVSALMAFCPMLAACILTRRARGPAGVAALLKRAFDFRRIADTRWYLPVLLLMPAVSLLVYAGMRVPGLAWLATPAQAKSISQLLADFQAGSAWLMFAAFFVGALGEELGWSGYILDPLQKQWGALRAGLILGAVAMAWHLVPLVAMHRSPAWIAWWCLYVVSSRVLIVWIFNNTRGSVFAAALFHASLNLSFMLFPVNGSHFDMRLAGLIMAGLAGTVVVFWGPRTLACYRHASRR